MLQVLSTSVDVFRDALILYYQSNAVDDIHFFLAASNYSSGHLKQLCVRAGESGRFRVYARIRAMG